MNSTQGLLEQVMLPWQSVHASLGLAAPLDDDTAYETLLAFVDEAFARFGADDAHPVMTLVALAAERIRDYEARKYPWPDTLSGAELLRFLLDQHQLAQNDLPEVGTQSVISEILSGKRQFNLRQVSALSRRFGVPMEAFSNFPEAPDEHRH